MTGLASMTMAASVVVSMGRMSGFVVVLVLLLVILISMVLVAMIFVLFPLMLILTIFLFIIFVLMKIAMVVLLTASLGKGTGLSVPGVVELDASVPSKFVSGMFKA